MAHPLLRPTNGPDSIVGTAGDDTLKGRGGDDQLWGGAGNDALLGGGGDDSLHGGEGDDLLDGGTGRNSLYGGTGDDVAFADAEGPAGVVLDGGDGTDRLSVGAFDGDGLAGAVRIDLTAGLATLRVDGAVVATAAGFETLEVVAGEGDDRVRAAGGDDVLFVAGGANAVAAGAGDDTVGYTVGEACSLDGGAGLDTLFVTADEDRPLAFNGAAGADGAGSTLSGFEAFNVFGSERSDLLVAGRGQDMVAAGGGDDNLGGLGGDDTLFGASGRDRLWGDEGDDQLWGGDGTDQLRGAAGADSFWFSAADGGTDRLRDFEAGVDSVMVDAAITGGALAAGELDPTRFRVGAAAGMEGQFVLLDAGADDRLAWDANGTGAGGVTVVAVLSGAPGLAAEDIVLF